MAEEAKKSRRTAKGRFTRKRKELLKSIENESGIEIIETNYASFVEAWSSVEGKHDLYTMHLEDEEIEAADEWITNLQDLFTEATKLKISYVKNIAATEAQERAKAEHKELQKRERELIQSMIDQSIIKIHVFSLFLTSVFVLVALVFFFFVLLFFFNNAAIKIRT